MADEACGDSPLVINHFSTFPRSTLFRRLKLSLQRIELGLRLAFADTRDLKAPSAYE